jgi:hypothetical protein
VIYESVGVQWRRASKCSESNCVEIANFAGGFAIRDSTEPDKAILWFPAPQWQEFVRAIRAGEFDDLLEVEE